MKALIFGAGLMARAVAYDLVRQKDVEKVFVVDQDRTRLRQLKRWLKSPKLKTIEADVTNRHLIELLAHCAVGISCVPYEYNLKLTRMAIAAKTNLCDLGGNNTIVRKQLALDKKAQAANITVIPDCGLAPGITNVLVADAVSRLDRTDEVHIRVGGLPQKPEPPIFYRLVFSAQGLLNEYIEPCLILRNGKIFKVKPMTEPEEIIFPKPFGRLEAFHTSGGSSTLVETFKDRVQELDYKTIRYPQHRLMFQLLLRAAVGNWQKLPRSLLACALEKVLGYEKDDCVLLRVDVRGKLNGRERLLRYQLIDYADRKKGLTAMMRTTGFAAAIVALMLARREIQKKGVLPGEKAIPSKRFIAELRQRGLNLKYRLV
ncbi:MAG: saccharopine dehydrogenase C-terminal domain-containing protein [candidate division WOR-3 bacterium]